MQEEVYDYLVEYGFTNSEIDQIESNNDAIFSITIDEIIERMMYLESKQIDKQNVIRIININPNILSVSDNEFSTIDDLFIDELNFDLSELSYLIINNPYLYNVGLKKIKQIINILYSKNIDEKDIKSVVLKNPRFIS